MNDKSNGQRCLDWLREFRSHDELLGNFSPATIDQATILLRRGTPEIIGYVDEGLVPMAVATDAVRHRHKKDLAGWTPEDVLREGRKVRNERPSQKRGARSHKDRKNRRPDPPRPRLQLPTPAETGLPMEGTLEERDAHHKQYGRAPVFAKEVKDRLDAEFKVNTYLQAIVSVTNPNHPDTETFFAALSALLATQPEKGKPDVAAKARHQLGRLRERLPIMLGRALELACYLENRDRQVLEQAPAGKKEEGGAV
jgi:hypothetical protein